MTWEEKFNEEILKVLQKIKLSFYLSEVGIPIAKFYKDPNEKYETDVLNKLVDYGAIKLLDDPVNIYLDKLKDRTIDPASVSMDPGINIDRYFSEEGVQFFEILEYFDSVYQRFNPQDKAVEFKKGRVKFSDGDQPRILVDGVECLIPKNSLEHFLCKVMFKKDNKAGKFISWDEIFIEMDGANAPPEDRSESIYGATRRLNSRIQRKFHTRDALMTWEDKHVKRNF